MTEKRCLAEYRGHDSAVWDVTSSPLATYFVSASFDRTLRLWNTEYVYPLRTFAGHTDSVDVRGINFYLYFESIYLHTPVAIRMAITEQHVCVCVQCIYVHVMVLEVLNLTVIVSHVIKIKNKSLL